MPKSEAAGHTTIYSNVQLQLLDSYDCKYLWYPIYDNNLCTNRPGLPPENDNNMYYHHYQRILYWMFVGYPNPMRYTLALKETKYRWHHVSKSLVAVTNIRIQSNVSTGRDQIIRISIQMSNWTSKKSINPHFTCKLGRKLYYNSVIYATDSNYSV